MSGLLRLYPAAWRERYEEEFLALLEARPPTLGDRFDVVRGAIDARLHPQVGQATHDPIKDGDTRDARRLGIATVVGAIAWVAAFGVVLMGPIRYDGDGAYRDGSAAFPFFFASVVLIVGGLVGHVIVLPRRARLARASAIIAMPLILLLGLAPWMWPLGMAAALFVAVLASCGLRAGTWPAWASTLVVVGVLGAVVIMVYGLTLTGLDRMAGGVLFLMAGLCFVPVWLGVGGSLVAPRAPVRLPPA